MEVTSEFLSQMYLKLNNCYLYYIPLVAPKCAEIVDLALYTIIILVSSQQVEMLIKAHEIFLKFHKLGFHSEYTSGLRLGQHKLTRMA